METFILKTKLCFGGEPLAALSALSGKRVMIVTDAFLAGSGLLERVTARLSGCTLEVFDKVEPDPSLALVAAGVKSLLAFGPEAVVAFGGGSPMDCAKAMRYFAKCACALWCIPTTAGTGAEMTSFAVLTDTDKGVKYPLVDDALLPDTAILDPDFLTGVPPKVTADTGMDVLTHAAEALVATKANPFTDALAEKAFAMAYESLSAAHRGDRAGKENLLYASSLAGIAFNAAGLGVCHSLAHALGGRFHTPHGRLNAMLLPHVIGFNAAGENPAAAKYARLAKRCGLAATPRALASALVRLRASLEMPGGMKVPAADLPALIAATLADVCLEGNPRAVRAADVEALLKGLNG